MSDPKEVSINKEVSGTYTGLEGERLFHLLIPYFEAGSEVQLSFENIQAISSSFYRMSIGALIDKFGKDYFNRIVKIVKISKSNSILLRKYHEFQQRSNN